MSPLINFLAMLVLQTASTLAISEAGPSCNDVGKALTPCLDFIKGKNPRNSPSPACCGGAKALANQARTKPAQQAVCECLKGVFANVGPSYDPFLSSLIPKKCGLNVYIPPITGNVDCSK